MSFQQFDLSAPISKAIAEMGFTDPSEIQSKAIPVLQSYSGDFIGQAQTGTGKTAAFLIPLLEDLDPENKAVQALVLAPTRELANQVHGEVEKLTKYLNIRSTTVYGGVSYDRQISFLSKVKPQVVVGTPGRVIDLMKRGKLRLQETTQLVIDEADEMLNMGFIEDVQTIIDNLHPEKRMWMFSATMPKPITQLVKKKFSQPKVVKVEKETLSNADIQQFYCVIKRKHFAEALLRYISIQDCYGMVFCETRLETQNLTDLLLEKGVSAVALHGELGQAQRDYALQKFRNRQVDLMICTDVAGRGIDVSEISHVFNMGLPRQEEVYVHRIGRTGRAGTSGVSISFVTPDSQRKLRRIEGLCGQKMLPLQWPKSEEIKELRITKELRKLDRIKNTLLEEKANFKVDPAFKVFQKYFEDLSKTQILRLMFTHQFNREMRSINQSENLAMDNFEGATKSASRRERSQRRSRNEDHRSKGKKGKPQKGGPRKRRRR